MSYEVKQLTVPFPSAAVEAKQKRPNLSGITLKLPKDRNASMVEFKTHKQTRIENIIECRMTIQRFSTLVMFS